MTELIEVELNEVTEENQPRVFNLEDLKDREVLGEELNAGSMYFKPQVNISYKIRLLSPNVKEVEKTFEDKTITKYELSISAKGSDKSEFEGLWEVGRNVLKSIFDDYEASAVYNIKKTGSGIETRYSVTKDF